MFNDGDLGFPFVSLNFISGIFFQRHLTVSSINDIIIVVDSIIDDSQICDRSSDVDKVS